MVYSGEYQDSLNNKRLPLGCLSVFDRLMHAGGGKRGQT